MATALREKKQFTAAFAFSDELAVGVMAAPDDAGRGCLRIYRSWAMTT